MTVEVSTGDVVLVAVLEGVDVPVTVAVLVVVMVLVIVAVWVTVEVSTGEAVFVVSQCGDDSVDGPSVTAVQPPAESIGEHFFGEAMRIRVAVCK